MTSPRRRDRVAAATFVTRAALSGTGSWFAILALAWTPLACADEAFTPDDCKELPQYDIREARRSGGAVQRSGTIGGSPLSAEEQRELQRLAARGCVTLPSKEYSLKDRDRDGG